MYFDMQIEWFTLWLRISTNNSPPTTHDEQEEDEEGRERHEVVAKLNLICSARQNIDSQLPLLPVWMEYSGGTLKCRVAHDSAPAAPAAVTTGAGNQRRRR